MGTCLLTQNQHWSYTICNTFSMILFTHWNLTCMLNYRSVYIFPLFTHTSSHSLYVYTMIGQGYLIHIEPARCGIKHVYAWNLTGIKDLKIPINFKNKKQKKNQIYLAIYILYAIFYGSAILKETLTLVKFSILFLCIFYTWTVQFNQLNKSWYLKQCRKFETNHLVMFYYFCHHPGTIYKYS